MEKSKISRAEENKQSQCVEGCDWSNLAGDWMPASDWTSPRIPGQQRLNGGGSIQHSGVSYARPESARIGNILRFLTTLMQPPSCLLRVMSCIESCMSVFSLASSCMSRFPVVARVVTKWQTGIQSTRLAIVQSFQLQSCCCRESKHPIRTKTLFRTSRLGQESLNLSLGDRPDHHQY